VKCWKTVFAAFFWAKLEGRAGSHARSLTDQGHDAHLAEEMQLRGVVVPQNIADASLPTSRYFSAISNVGSKIKARS
jgi:hypothetical protein